MPAPEHTVDEVTHWLKKEGYRIEFEVARAFQNSSPNLSITMGACIGPELGDKREVDLRVMHTACTYGRVMIVCECKYLPSPWILLYGEQRTDALSSSLLAARTKTLTQMGPTRDVLESLEFNFHFRSGERAAHSVIEALKKGNDKDRAYATMMKLTDATFTYADVIDELNSRGAGFHMLFLPLVVIDGQLFEASYDSAARDLIVKEVTWGRVNWTAGRRPLLIDVVSLKQVPEYVPWATESVVHLGSLIRQYLESTATRET